MFNVELKNFEEGGKDLTDHLPVSAAEKLISSKRIEILPLFSALWIEKWLEGANWVDLKKWDDCQNRVLKSVISNKILAIVDFGRQNRNFTIRTEIFAVLSYRNHRLFTNTCWKTCVTWNLKISLKHLCCEEKDLKLLLHYVTFNAYRAHKVEMELGPSSGTR